MKIMKRNLLFLLIGILMTLSLISCDLKIPDLTPDDSSSDDSSIFDDSSTDSSYDGESSVDDESSNVEDSSNIEDDSSSIENESSSEDSSWIEDESSKEEESSEGGSGDIDDNGSHRVTLVFGNGEQNKSFLIKHGEKIPKPSEPQRNGYKFDGWFIDDEEWIFIGYNVTEPITLTAKWTPIEYKITGYPNKTSYTIEDEFELLDADDKDGYTFDYWTLEGKPIIRIKKGTTGDLALNAKYSLITYTITYVDEFNAENTNAIEFTAENPVILKDVSCADKTFFGWYCNGEKITTVSVETVGYNDVTVTATWKKVLKDWSGKTLTVLATRYSATGGAPWGQFELNPISFGENLNTAFENRQAFILQEYGVTVKWVESYSPQSISSELAEAKYAENANYDIALPRLHEVQQLTSYVYDMGKSEYIDFSQSYYSQIAYEAFTVADVTLFATGDFDFMDDQVTYALFFNEDALSTLTDNDIYELVDEGEWTFDILKSISRAYCGDLNGNLECDDDDKYGYGTKTFTRFFNYFGINEVSVVDGLYKATLKTENTNAVVNTILECTSGTNWCRVNWGGTWGSNLYTAFAEGRVLFYEEVVHQTQNFDSTSFEIGILPFPKLNSEQENYCTTLAPTQATVICIPKATQDREMSEAFVEILSQTGQEYIIPEFQNTYFASISDDGIEAYKNHIKPNMVYDAGIMNSWESTVYGSLKYYCYNEGQNRFDELYETPEYLGNANTIIESWNANWKAYTEE